MRVDSPSTWKRRRYSPINPMDAESAKAKLAAAMEKFGREISVFETSTSSATASDASSIEEGDDFYEFTAEDYYRIMASQKNKEEKYLKTRKIREAEEAARRSRITKAVIRVRFLDNHTLEATFHPSEKIESLVDLLMKAVSHPELPFYIYTTPPKKQIKDASQDFYTAGLVPGAIVYFSYDLPQGEDNAVTSGPYLKEEIMSLKGLEYVAEHVETMPPPAEPVVPTISTPVEERKPADKKNARPKWFKM